MVVSSFTEQIFTFYFAVVSLSRMTLKDASPQAAHHRQPLLIA